MTRILCAWSPSWPIANWRRRHPAASPEPLALVETVRGTRRLSSIAPEGQALGLFAGQKAADAAALVKGLAVAEAQPEVDAADLAALTEWCALFSPAVAADPPDGLILDITGVDHLWGGEAALLADFKASLARLGLPFRAAVADTAGAAWALAHFADDGAIAPPGAQEAMLAPLPPPALRLSPETAAQLHRLGIKRLGQLIDAPRGPFARRFGAGLLTRLDQALGRAEEALAFRRPPTPWFTRLAFVEPISTPEDLGRVAFDIVEKLCRRLEREGMGARRFELVWRRLDGAAPAVVVGLSRAGRDPGRIARLFAPKLETVDPGFGIEAATLRADGVEPLAERQRRLDARRDDAEGEIAALVDRLANRLGEARVWKGAPVESHVPELASAPAPALEPWSAAPWDPERPRPVRLFSPPESIEVVALAPDDPPVQFRWRGLVRRVRRAEGPERIAEEWWKGPIDAASPSRLRDYYRIEDQEGGRYWVFRAGLHEPGQPARWWLHGLFG